MTTRLTTATTRLDDALDAASRGQIQQLESRVGLPVSRLRAHNTRGLAGWIRREVADTLGYSVGHLFPERDR